jgi:glycosyltransferase involved in cell wall biosynthesis
VTPWYPAPESPAAGTFVREHARAAALFDQVALVHLLEDGSMRRVAFELEQVPDEPFPVIRVRYRAVRYTGWLVELLALARAVRSLRESRFNPDLLHAHVASRAAPAALYSRIANVPLVLTEHWTGFLDADPHPVRWVAALFSRVALKRAKKVLPVGSALRAAMQRFAPDVPYQVVPNVIDCEIFRPQTPRPPANPIRLIAVGLLSAQKDYPTMLHAVRLLLDGDLPVRLEIIGYGDCQPELAQMIEENRLEDHVELVGYLPKAEVAEHLRRSHVFTHSSRFETFCAAAAEALASGIPVVSTRCGGPEDYVTPDTGRLVPVGDSQALAAGVKEVIDQLDSFTPDRIAAHARARFAPEVVGRRLHDLYTSIDAASPQRVASPDEPPR